MRWVRLGMWLGVWMLLTPHAWAALPVTTTWELNASASAGNVNGGGFNHLGANFATDLACTSANTASPVCTSASYNFVAGDVGHWLYVKSGTNWTALSFCQIASVAANAATLTAGAGTCNVLSTTKNPAPFWGTNSSAGVASVASPTSGTWGVDYSRSTAAFATTTTLASDAATPSIWSGGGISWGVNLAHNIFQLTAGTNATQGWYECVTPTGTQCTMDRNSGTGTTNFSVSIGGAISLGSSTANRTDDIFFELGTGTNGTGAHRFFIKNGSYSPAVITTAAAGGTQAPVVVEGYNTTRGDAPKGATRPDINMAANGWTKGANWDAYYLDLTGTASSVFVVGASGKDLYVKVVNTSSTINRNAFSTGATPLLFGCEAVSYRGYGINSTSGGALYYFYNYVHDSDIGIRFTSTGGHNIIGNVIENMLTTGIAETAAVTTGQQYIGNTIYGSENTTGSGITFITGTTNVRAFSNIFYGLTTGIVHPDVQSVSFDDFNDFNNNDVDVAATAGGASDGTRWPKGNSDSTLAPTFANVTQVTGTTGAFVAGNNKLVDTSKNFTTLGVGANEIVNITGGTGATTGLYLIDSISTTTNPNDTLNITIPAGPGTNTTADKTWQITLGHNFAIGTNLKALGFPGAFPGALTTGYTDIGAVQRQESGSGAWGF